MTTDLVENKKKNRYKILKTILVIGVLCISMIGYGIYWAFFDMNRLPTGEYLNEQTSSNGAYTIKAYLINGGATTSYSIRGELVFNNRIDKKKNVYWNDREESAKIEWIDDDTVVINGHKLTVPRERYDFRNQ